MGRCPPGHATLIEQIKEALKQPGKSQAGLGRALGVHRGQVTRLLDGDRRLQIAEIEACEDYLGVPLEPLVRAKGSRGSTGLMLMGVIDGSWRERGQPQKTTVRPVADQRYPEEDQHAFRLEMPSTDHAFRPGDTLIGVDWSAYRSAPQVGDYMIQEADRNGLASFSLWKAERVGKEIELVFVAGPSSLAGTRQPARGKATAGRFVSLVIAKQTMMA